MWCLMCECFRFEIVLKLAASWRCCRQSLFLFIHVVLVPGCSLTRTRLAISCNAFTFNDAASELSVWKNWASMTQSVCVTVIVCINRYMFVAARRTTTDVVMHLKANDRHVHFQTSALQFRLWHEYILREIFPTTCFLINGCVQRPLTVSSDVETLDGKYIWQRCDENTFFSRIYWRKSIPHAADDFINHSDVCLFRSVAVVPDRLRATK